MSGVTVLRAVIGAMLSLTVLGAALAQAPADASPAAANPPGALPIEAFYAKPTFSRAAISPDGAYLAYSQQQDGVSAIVVRLVTGGAANVIATIGSKDMTVDEIAWKDNNRLVVGLHLWAVKFMGDKATRDPIHLKYGEFVFAMNRDGKNQIQLFSHDVDNRWAASSARIAVLLRNDSDHLLALAPDWRGDDSVWKVNIRTGETALVEQGGPNIIEWYTDSTGAVIGRRRHSEGSEIIEARAPGETDWTKVATVRRRDWRVIEDFEIIGATDKPDEWFVIVKPQSPAEGDTRRLHIYNVATKTLGPPISPSLKYDIDSIRVDEVTGELTAYCYTVDAEVCDYLDPTIEAHYRGLTKYFGDDSSIEVLGDPAHNRSWLLGVSGPGEPQGYYLYDKSSARVDLLAERYPDLSSDRLGTKTRFSFTSRDGVTIPGYLIRPPNAPVGPLPLVVLPHGGPEARDNIGFETWSQILATRGYMVFQPNFRGSSGYGVSYSDAGHHQWGDRMANDITDGVKALIAAGQADPSRICIFGASYGGYAALYAGATHPELYKCVVSWAGLSDLTLDLQHTGFNYGKDSAAYRWWTSLIGDPDRDGAEIKAASPITYAEGYKLPVLLLHGKNDEVVEPVQSELIASALKHAGHDVQLTQVNNEGHPYWSRENEQPAMIEVVTFIEAHIAPAPLTPVASPLPAAKP